MLNKTLFAAALLSALFVGCKGPAGPPGDAESLSDPSVQPKVIYTYPPANSLGPYPELAYSNQIQIRFNKFMDLTSVRRAIKLSSPTTSTRNDTSSISSSGGDLFYARVVDSSGYYFPGWKTYETYTLSIASSAKDINGNSLLPPYSMTFVPEPFFRIRSVYPVDGATGVSGTAGITLAFNSPVDSSIFASILISPLASGKWSLYSWDSTSISYNTILMSNTTYTITVGTSAHDKYGHHLPQEFTSTFTTSIFRVSSTSPYDGDTYVGLDNSVVVYFSAAIDTGSVRSAFRITPPTAGYFLPVTLPTANFIFVPSNGLLSNTTYTVTVDSSIQSSSGNRLAAPYTFSFTTAPLQLTYTHPYGGETGVNPNLYVYVNFNAEIDTGSVRAAFSMKDFSGANVPGTFFLSDQSSDFFYLPSNLPLPANARYTVTITTALRSTSGTHLASPYTFSFTTGN